MYGCVLHIILNTLFALQVDSATNNIRKLQRTNDEFQEQVESLQVQVEHLQTRYAIFFLNQCLK